MSELKPCPFCGGEAWLVDHPRKGEPYCAEVRCQSVACKGSSGKWVDATGASHQFLAIHAWNTRTTSPSSGVDVEAVLKAVYPVWCKTTPRESWSDMEYILRRALSTAATNTEYRPVWPRLRGDARPAGKEATDG